MRGVWQPRQPAGQIEYLALRIDQADGAPAQPNDEVGPTLAGFAEALPGLRIGLTAIGDAYLALDRLTTVKGFAATRIGEVQVRKPPDREVADTMNGPVGACAGRRTQAGAVGNAPTPAGPSRQGLRGR